MADAKDNTSELSAADGSGQRILEYSSPLSTPANFSSMRIVLPFALGVMLPFLAGFVTRQDGDWISLGCFVSWGVSALLLISIKVRGIVVRLNPRGRPWWVSTIAGIMNALALFLVVEQTTGRQTFWPVLGAGGSFLVAVVVAAVIGAVTATVLSPRDRGPGSRGRIESENGGAQTEFIS